MHTALGPETALRLSLTPGVALSLLRDLANATANATTTAAAEIAAGDCETCGNSRLVTTTDQRGRDWREHCPDCDKPSTFPAAPPLRPGTARH